METGKGTGLFIEKGGKNLNRSKIEYCDHTWNPITGCRHNCEYCYARRMVARFTGDIRLNKMAKKEYSLVDAADGGEDLYILDTPMLNETGKPLIYPFGFAPTLHRYRMDIPGKLKMGNNIFVGAMADMFGSWVPDKWLSDIFNICRKYPIHNYLFLTKNPDRYVGLCLKELLPEHKNMWYGATVTNSCQAYTAEAAMQDMPSEAHAFLSIEPILEDVSGALGITIANFTDWVIIGAETGNGKGRVIPEKGWIDSIVKQCDSVKIPVFMKESLLPVVGEEDMRRELPKQLQHSAISPKMEAKMYDVCAECKARMKKSDMITLLARSRRGEQPKQFGFLCKECFKRFCGKLGLDVPQLAGLEYSVTIEAGDADG